MALSEIRDKKGLIFTECPISLSDWHETILLFVGLSKGDKKTSNEFIKEKRFTRFQFYRQEGFSAFSHGHSSLDSVIQYIQNQKGSNTRNASLS